MRASDYLEHAWSNLWKKKLRTFLTTSGVVIGIGALVCMFAFGQGIQQNIRDQFEAMDLLNYINVSPRHGGAPTPADGDPDAQPRHTAPPPVSDPNQEVTVLDDAFIDEVLQIDGVEAAFPEMRFPAQVRLGDKEQFTLVQVVSSKGCGSGLIQLRAGAPYTSDEPNEVILSDTLLRRLGNTKSETAVGTEVEIRTITLDFSVASLMRMAFSRGDQRLPISDRRYSFKVVGVVERMGFGGALPIRSDVFIPPGAADRMRKLVLTGVSDLFQPAEKLAGYSTVTIRVASPAQVATVKAKLEERGLRTFALMDQLAEMRMGFVIMDMFLLAVGMIGITVASLGIVNTMVMSILERYREIGIMKAVGATDGDVQKIFLFESGMIGLLGGVFGLLLAKVVSFVINEVVNGFASGEGVPFIQYFSFPWWLCAGAVAFSILVSLIAGIYPTRRAARVDPVVALRHD
ncbi:MAG: ABC transporter permease [Phycisphaerales bacterium]|nr:MAG: ABC transporter permease [Phycisphaerales bacterium]